MAGKGKIILWITCLPGEKAVPMLIVMANGMVMDETAEGETILRHNLFPEELVEDIIPFIEKNTG